MKKAIFLFSILCGITLMLAAQTETLYPEGLKVGDAAPMFTAKDQEGKTINLEQALKKGRLLCFFTEASGVRSAINSLVIFQILCKCL